jgi:hypothetical protein
VNKEQLMKKYNFFTAPFLSFFSKDFYVELATKWKGTGLLHLFLLLLLAWGFYSIKVYVNFAEFIDEEMPPVVNQIPVINITDGVASTETDEIFEIRGFENNELFCVVDTTGEITSLDDTEAKMLVVENGIHMRQGPNRTKFTSFQEVEEFTVTPEVISRFLAMMKLLWLPICFPFFILFSFAFRGIQLLVYAGIGMVMTTRKREQFSFGVSYRLCAYSITPVIVVSTLFDLIGVGLPFYVFWLFSFMLAVGYIYFSTNAVMEYYDNGGANPPKNNGVVDKPSEGGVEFAEGEAY